MSDASCDNPGNVPSSGAAVRTITLIVAAAVLAGVLCWRSTRYDILSSDDPIWFHRSNRPAWRFRTDRDYDDAVDVPALNRWVYGAVLKVTGFHKLPAAPEDTSGLPPTRAKGEMWKWHVDRKAKLAMMCANACFFAAAMALLWQAAYLVFRSWWLAALSVAPLFASKQLSYIVAHRIGPDAFLVFGLALTLFLWQHFHSKASGASWRAVVVVGVAAGITTSAKLNGGLVLLAYAAYVAAAARGRGRFFKPVAACAVAFAVFSVINPAVFLSGRLPWAVLSDMLRRRFEVVSNVDAAYGPYTLVDIWTRPLSIWPLLPLLAAAQIVAALKCRLIRPVVLWGAFLFLGTMLTINIPVAWYVAPAHLGLYFPSAVAVIALTRDFLIRNLVLSRNQPSSGDAENDPL